MTKEELYKEREKLYEDYQVKTKEICQRYAEQHNDIKVGDIIQTVGGDPVKVEGIDLAINSFYDKSTVPMYNYSGHKCNKKGVVAKNASYAYGIAQCWIVRVNGKPYDYNIYK